MWEGVEPASQMSVSFLINFFIYCFFGKYWIKLLTLITILIKTFSESFTFDESDNMV